MAKKTDINDEVLINTYFNENLSISKLAKKHHVGSDTIIKVFKRNHVEFRKKCNIHPDESELDVLDDVIFDKKKSRAKDMIGKKFNMLTVVKRLTNQGKYARYFCLCDCGKTRIVLGQNLRSGRVKDCGCISQKLKKLHLSQKLKTHGFSKTRLYSIWLGIRDRCSRVKNQDYYLYGGRGIKVCDEWNSDFLTFRNWALNNGYNDNLSIDRIDPDGNYEPNNCRWITLTEQTYNKRNTRKVYYKENWKTAAEWGKIFNKPSYVVYNFAKRHEWKIDALINNGAANE